MSVSALFFQALSLLFQRESPRLGGSHWGFLGTLRFLLPFGFPGAGTNVVLRGVGDGLEHGLGELQLRACSAVSS